jgi:CRP-like cAMP-binding protein
MDIKKTIPKTRSSSWNTKMVRKQSSSFSENDFFKGLKPDELAGLFERMKIRSYPARSLIFTPQEPSCENLYLLNQGQVEMYRLTAGGKRLVTRHISTGGVFGVRGLFGCGMQKNFAEATAASTIGVISRMQVLEQLKRQPDLMLRILENICSRLYLLEDRLVEAVYNPVSVRLAYFLLTNAEAASGVLTDITHEEIGSRIGAVRQTVTENLSLMRKQGLLQIEPRKIQVLDRPRLEKIILDSSS